ncbi:alanyl-tRNA editing protein [Spirochaeta isovalerica]|uniref:Alanyl-tRNA synthetase n=1 Tax=Spirochaeta isovalerica TaxID=150 RepID=A0A841RCQ4_9SPIO|nr:alanyl-tRNA editing protein [Spirochaeta isovalerica]MBB6481017.1 alanyl-tRNA synthetase [Spirochaeta isovalerica]
MTEKLFYNDPYLYSFTCSVISAVEEKGLWKLELDRTAFYPEGGGQPADRGLLGGQEVVDVQKDKGHVFHYLKEKPSVDELKGEVDRIFRMDYMQQHTGQHILSAVLKRVAGAATVAVHQAEDYTSIEIDHSEFPAETIELIEDEANKLVCANHPVYCFLNGDIPISLFPLRRDTKFTEDVRLVQIGGESLENRKEALEDAAKALADDFESFSPGIKDLAACGGVHLKRTGEVGLIKFQKQEKVRGRLRLFWLIGNRAYRDYRTKSQLTDKIGEALSVPLSGIESEFNRFMGALGEEKKRNSDLLKEMASLKAEEIRGQNQSGKQVFLFDKADPSYFKQITIALSSFDNIHLCLLNISGGAGQWALISHKENTDFNVFRNDLLSLLDGKGGGKAPLWQGKIGKTEEIDVFADQFESAFS